MLRKLLLTVLFFASLQAFSQNFTNEIGNSGLPSAEGQILDVVDYNNDGYEDVVFQNSASGKIELYRNLNGKFTNVTYYTGFPDISLSGANDEGVVSFDYNGDGFMDLLISRAGSLGYLRLLRNNCGVNYTEVTSSSGLSQSINIVNQAYTRDPIILISDYDKDRDNDIILCRLSGGEYWVSVLQNSGGVFSTPSDLVTSFGSGIIPYIALIDYDNDFDDDLLIIQNSDINKVSKIDLYDNSGTGNFTVITSPTGLENSNALGFANIIDADNDGFMDILLGTREVVLPGSGNSGNKLFHNENGTGTFTNITSSYITYSSTNAGDNYNSHVFDLDNDGDNEVFWEVHPNSGSTAKPSLMYNNGSNIFIDRRNLYLSLAATSADLGNKYTIFDYNHDGYMDVFVYGSGSVPDAQLLLNPNTGNNYIKIKLLSCSGQTDPVGSRVMISSGGKRQFKAYNSSGISTSSSNSSEWMFFGIGSATTVDTILVYLPDGTTIFRTNVLSNQDLLLKDASCPLGDPLTFDLGKDTTSVCNSDTAEIIAPSGYDTYSWNTGDATSAIKVTSEGFYYCTVTNATGCSITDSIYVVFGKANILQNDTTICGGSTIKLDAYPRYDCSPFGAPKNVTITEGQDLGPDFSYLGARNGHFYYLMTTPTTWSVAAQKALNAGGYLAVINEEEEQIFLQSNPLVAGKNSWIGLYKDSINGDFHWMNCDPLTYTNWATSDGAPVTGGTENYAYMRNKGCSSPNQWGNVDETVSNPDVCFSAMVGILEFDPSTNVTYVWNTGDGTPSITVKPSATDSVFEVHVFHNGAECTDAITIKTIGVNNLLPLDIIKECHTSSVLVQATEGMNSYLWNNGRTTSGIFVNTKGWYKVTATSPEGCVGSDSAYVSLFNANIFTQDTTVCKGTNVLLRGPVPPYNFQSDYNYTFQAIPFIGWSISNTINFNSSKVLGPFSNDSVRLNLTLPMHDSVIVTYDLYIHDTWEGNCSPNGPDQFRFKNGLTNLINTTFSNTIGCKQDYPVANSDEFTGASVTGLPRRCDINGITTKYTITKKFRHSSTNLDLSWVGQLSDLVDNSSKCNESWSIDNVIIEVRRPGGVLWSTGDTDQNIFVLPSDPTNVYWVRVPVDTGYCWDSVIVSTVTDKLPYDLIPIDSFNSCGAYQRLMGISDKFDHYSWSTGYTTDTTRVYNTGWVKVYASLNLGCYAEDSAFVPFNNPDLIPSSDTSICYGTSITLKNNLHDGCSPFGSPANTGYTAGSPIAGYTYLGSYLGHYYYIADSSSNWSIAAQKALAAGGYLANILDTGEQKFIESITDSNVWLGLFVGSQGSHLWMNCDSLTYTNWATGEPSAAPENYVYMYSSSCAEPKKWNSYLDDDSGSDPCLSHIYGLLEIAPNTYQYAWYEDFNLTYTTDTISVSPLTKTRYMATVALYPGGPTCTSGIINVGIIKEDFGIIPDSIIKISCAGDTVMVEATPGYSNYSWNNGDTTEIATYSAYIGWAYCSYNNGTCTFTDSVYLNVPGPLVANSQMTNITCKGSNDGVAIAGATGGTQPYSILWIFNGSTTDIQNSLAPGTYTYTLTDSNGCVLTDSVIITEPDTALDFTLSVLKGVSCNGDSNGIVAPIIVGGERPYSGQWVGYTDTDTLWTAKAGTLTYTVTDFRGCVQSKDITITEPDPLILSANIAKQIYCEEDSNGIVKLIATGGTTPYHFVWNMNLVPGDSVFNVYKGTFTAIVVDTNFCVDSMTVTMTESNTNPDLCGLVVPAGFTPNGDGKNDYLYIKGLAGYPDNELIIFNRWGETVFSVTNYQNNWEGKADRNTLLTTANGLLPNDTYFYVLITKSNNKKYSGYIYLTR